MRARAALLVLTALLVQALGTAGAAAQDDGPVGFFTEVELIPAEGTLFSWDGHTYAGALIIRGNGDGLTLIERVPPERYLLGLQEVPFSWHQEALKTQAVAARTYLAWTLARERAGAARYYGFDICATSACQVYGGLDLVNGSGGERWREAVTSTAGEVLLFEGAPAFSIYSSTSGGSTNSIEDVYVDRDPVPYLKGVVSEGESSPYVDWAFHVPANVMQEIIDAWGELAGHLTDIDVDAKDSGEGPWIVRLVSDVGGTDLTTWEFRSVMNRWGPEVAPEVLPALRPDGRAYPQVVLSPDYTVVRQTRYIAVTETGDIGRRVVYRFHGGGWGHTVGLSQYGALAMAERGANYAQILGHYYRGLVPDEAPDVLPDEIDVGLVWARDRLTIRPDGAVTVIADGETIASEALGSWEFVADADDVEVRAPTGLGLPLVVRNVPPLVAASLGEAPVIPFTLSGAAEVRLVVFEGPAVVATTEWALREAGDQVIVWDGLVGGGLAEAGRYRLLVEARSSDLFAYQLTTVGIGAGR